jgi:hypothetical protein
VKQKQTIVELLLLLLLYIIYQYKIAVINGESKTKTKTMICRETEQYENRDLYTRHDTVVNPFYIRLMKTNP